LETYKAIGYDRFGSANELKLIDQSFVDLKPNEVLVKIIAAAVNPLDWKIRRGDMKFIPGQHFPHLIGSDLAGIVAKRGTDVKEFKEGDPVWGWLNAIKGEAYAEYAVVDTNNLLPKPETLTFEQAACIPTIGFAAIQALRDVGRVQPGYKILINGCTGGVAQFAVPLAKSYGALVTGTCNTNSVETAKKLGVDNVIDYTKENIHNLDETFDVIFDLAANLVFDDIQSLLTPKGVFINPAPTPAIIASSFLHNLAHSKKHSILMSTQNCTDGKLLLDAIDKLSIDIKVGSTYPLAKAAEAHADGEKGGKGKIVLIANESKGSY
jgi:NADPH:quinone reductase-like Zn-dependent oxidoreductase